LAERRPRLERHPGHPADVEIHFDNMVGFGKGPVGRLAVAEHRVDEDIVPRLVPDRRRARQDRNPRAGDARQVMIFDFHCLRCIERLRQSFGHHHRDRLADMPHPVRGEQRLRAKEDRAAVGSGQLQIVAGRRHRAVRDRSEAIRLAIPAAEHPEHARHPLCPGCADLQDSRMRVR
jgi:hypothetical protein